MKVAQRRAWAALGLGPYWVRREAGPVDPHRPPETGRHSDQPDRPRGGWLVLVGTAARSGKRPDEATATLLGEMMDAVGASALIAAGRVLALIDDPGARPGAGDTLEPAPPPDQDGSANRSDVRWRAVKADELGGWIDSLEPDLLLLLVTRPLDALASAGIYRPGAGADEPGRDDGTLRLDYGGRRLVVIFSHPPSRLLTDPPARLAGWRDLCRARALCPQMMPLPQAPGTRRDAVP